MEEDTTAMQQPATPSMSGQTVVALIQEEPDLSMLAQALQQAGLINALQQGGPYTVFAPSNEAFEGLPADLRGLIRPASDTTGGGQMAADTAGGQQNQQALRALLRRHVVADNVTSAAASNLNQAVTILGDTLDVSAEGGEVMVGEATVERADLEASNGVIHIIDAVLVPQGGVDELVRMNQQQEMQGQQQQGQQQQGQQPPPPPPVQDDEMEVEADTASFQQGQMEADTTTFQPEPMEDDPMEDMEEEVDTSGVNNR